MPFVQDDWSLIGHVGLSPGEAAQSVAGTEGSGATAQPGALNGYLQSVTTRGYQFISPEFATLDTHASASSSSVNVIKVGPSLDGPGGSYSSAALPGGRSEGFQLLELNPGTLQPTRNATYVTRNANGEVNGGGVQALATNLFPATANAGAAPLDASGNPLTDKLFSKPTAYSQDTNPDGLDMNKDEFFGMSTWTTPRLQCGWPGQ